MIVSATLRHGREARGKDSDLEMNGFHVGRKNDHFAEQFTDGWKAGMVGDLAARCRFTRYERGNC